MYTQLLNSELKINSDHITQMNDDSYVYAVSVDAFAEELQKLFKSGLCHLSTIVGYQQNGKIILKYPLSSPIINKKMAYSMFLQTEFPIDHPIVIPSVMSLFPGSIVYEREVTELLGVNFSNNVEDGKLLLPDGFPNGLYPLRKETSVEEIKSELDRLGVGTNPTIPLQDKKDYSISIGPQHPTHKEPIRFQFFVEGESIQDVSLRLGFNHRGIEKALEMGTWQQNLYLIERICGICSAAHQLAYTITAEKVAKITHEIPDRANWLRVLISELERIHSHILWYGVLAHDGGYDLMFHITWRDREIVMDILEELTGNRVNYGIETIGGIRRDISKNQIQKTLMKLKELRKKVENHFDILEKEQSFVKRLSSVGPLSYHDAINLGAVGPTVRASGVDFDLRRDVPYAAYKELPITVFTQKSGDVYGSLLVRLDETIHSIDLCIYILENLPSGEIAIPVKNRLPVGEAHTRVEAPRGEDIHYILSTGGKGPDRHKVRAPTLANITSLLHRFRGMDVADIPMIIRLIDPCIGCMERVTFIDLKSGKFSEMAGDELIARSNRKYRLNKNIRLFEVI